MDNGRLVIWLNVKANGVSDLRILSAVAAVVAVNRGSWKTSRRAECFKYSMDIIRICQMTCMAWWICRRGPKKEVGQIRP